MAGQSLRQRALSGVRWTIAARIGLQIIIWPATIFVMRLLDPRDYGLLALAMIVIGFIALFGELGLGAGLVQTPAEVGENTARTASSAIVALNLALVLLLVLTADWIAAWFEEPDLATIMRVLTLDLIMSACAAVPQAMLERQLRFRELSIAFIAASLVGCVCTIAAALAGLGVWSLVSGTLAAALVRSALLITFYGRIVWPRLSLDFSPIRPMAIFSGHVIGARALWYWYGQADQVILGRVLNSSLLGNYSVAAQLASLPTSKAMDTINKVAFPTLSRLAAEPEKSRATYQSLLRVIAVYAFATCWGIAAIANEFVALVLSDKWHLAATPLTLLALVAPLRMLAAFNNTVTTAIGKPQAATKELAIASIAIPGAILVGVLQYGLNGAAIAWVLLFPPIYLVSSRLTCKALAIRLGDGLRPIAAPLLSGTLMFSSVWLIKTQFGGRYELPTLLAGEILTGALVYLLALRIMDPAAIKDSRALVLDLVPRSRVQR
jgi:teichuronic acid exporter